MLSPKLLITCVVAMMAVATPADAKQKELNLATDGITDPALTAVIISAKRSGFFSTQPTPYLQYITDLSAPADQQKPIQISTDWTSKYPRVGPGTYMVQAKCQTGGTYTYWKVMYMTVEAQAGKAYVLSCDGGSPNSWSLSMKQMEQAELFKP